METEIIMFTLFGALIVASSIGVIVMKNPIHSALHLVVSLLSVAGIFALLEAHFLATVQIIVYAGAIVVLILFVLMLLNVKVEPRSKREGISIAVAVVTGFAFLLYIVPMLAEVFDTFRGGELERIGVHSGTAVGTVRSVGRLLYTKYVFTFEVASLLIMAAIVGAVMLAKRRGPATIIEPRVETK